MSGTSRLEATVSDVCHIIYLHYKQTNEVARKLTIKDTEWSNTDHDWNLLHRFIMRVRAELNREG